VTLYCILNASTIDTPYGLDVIFQTKICFNVCDINRSRSYAIVCIPTSIYIFFFLSLLSYPFNEQRYIDGATHWSSATELNSPKFSSTIVQYTHGIERKRSIYTQGISHNRYKGFIRGNSLRKINFFLLKISIHFNLFI
jgi:hypothetical protein